MANAQQQRATLHESA